MFDGADADQSSDDVVSGRDNAETPSLSEAAVSNTGIL